MDILNNITGRDNGYPISTEIIEVLDEHRKYIESIMDGYKLSPGTCVFMSYKGTENINNAYVWVVPLGGSIAFGDFPYGGLYKLELASGVTVDQLISGEIQKSLVINTQSQDIISNETGELTDTWDNSIIRKTAQIVDVNFPTYQQYNFTTISRIINIDEFNYLPYLSVENANMGALTKDAYYTNIMRKRGKQIEIQVAITFGEDIGSEQTIEIPIMQFCELPVNENYHLSGFIGSSTNQLLVYICKDNQGNYKLFVNTSGFGSIQAGRKLYIKGIIYIM